MRMHVIKRISPFFFFNDTATTEIYTLSLHDALPIYLSGFLDHGDVDDVGTALRSLQDIFAPGIGDADHRQHARPGSHAAEVGSLGKGDWSMLHLNPDGLIAEVCGHLKEDGVVKVKGCPKKCSAVVFFNCFAQPIHLCLLRSC